MKKVIFICLLSLSACLSAPPVEDSKPAQAQVLNTLPKENNDEPEKKSPEPIVQTQTDNHTPGQTNATPSANETVPTQGKETQPLPPSSTETKANDTTPSAEKQTDKTTPEKTGISKDTAAKSPTETKDNAEKVTPNANAEKVTPNANAEKVTPVVKPEEHTEKKNETSTQKSDVTTSKDKTTEATKAETEKPEVVLQARGFDGPSFIGGMILTLGLIAIGLMGFKYYKAQTERNYHTL